MVVQKENEINRLMKENTNWKLEVEKMLDPSSGKSLLKEVSRYSDLEI